ncbi:Crp/Fnr family transcriptional regulator [Fischerella thermalis]|jgi:CRP/FNR family cyclic AMP-dependent transcriptional regulator|uniref:Putative transcriptional regulator, Crp/Fnr family n=2 Tax=Fischerella TaxID=1190 RepID=G6FNS8_9CYAN|nr:Crp/Fnr family transcriptional regulator [Fischerella thermalis]PMB09494.1 Crp/Fnr family transcriptional regulator [Fischerella thermalis CCMEE 5328]EHC18528.1 putative transcriptional regulator, Crp/Fnr family [Fischerella thermalis JSC-11]PLZ24912.1 Crp/Fnr family transcriptional regulator [Fischerella thermalis WC559]PLZ26812.1 Crp/Fnr family transcriptional regulator [Fischerella thermalis WC341]PLZ28197.1 Crp/Fnr family transcriptional regulator [Fischerella thermalis WC558]
MHTEVFSELFPLMSTANPQTLEWLLSVAVEHEYPAGRAVLMEDAWGNAVYFVVSGWVKVRRTIGEDSVALAILGRGDFFGEMAILDESPRSTDVIALSTVKLLSISRERFIHILFKDPQLHHRMLQLMVRRLRHANVRLQMRSAPPAVKLAHTLVSLGESYSEESSKGREIFNISFKDLADVTEIGVEETTKIMEKLDEKGWIKIDNANQVVHLVNFRQLMNLAGKV